MLLTIYENGENTTSFQTIFRDNVILPKFATLRLKNAFIGLNEVVNVATIQTFKFLCNDKTATPKDVVLPIGLYTLNDLAKTITTLGQASADTNFPNITFINWLVVII